MTFADYWAGVIPILVSVTIWMNYKRSVHGWLLGATVQACQVVFGIVTHHYLLLMSAFPTMVFLLAWKGALRDRKRPNMH